MTGPPQVPFLFSLRSPRKTETIYPISWRKPRFTKVAICKIIELVKRCCCYKQANLVTFKVNLFNWISSCSISYLLLFKKSFMSINVCQKQRDSHCLYYTVKYYKRSVGSQVRLSKHKVLTFLE